MSKGKRDSKRVSRSSAVLVIGLTLALAVLIVAVMQRLPRGGDGAAASEHETQEALTIMEYTDASYERYLAAGMTLALAMEYETFDQLTVYVASETSLAGRQSSQGAYIRFETGDGTVLLQSLPLEAERTESGARDLYSTLLGFNTFDEVPEDSVDLTRMEAVPLEELEELIGQSMLVSVYAH